MIDWVIKMVLVILYGTGAFAYGYIMCALLTANKRGDRNVNDVSETESQEEKKEA